MEGVHATTGVELEFRACKSTFSFLDKRPMLIEGPASPSWPLYLLEAPTGCLHPGVTKKAAAKREVGPRRQFEVVQCRVATLSVTLLCRKPSHQPQEC